MTEKDEKAAILSSTSKQPAAIGETKILYRFDDRELPYLITLLQSAPVKLKDFKKHIGTNRSKKYRFFFVSDHEIMGKVKKEIIHDEQLLPKLADEHDWIYAYLVSIEDRTGLPSGSNGQQQQQQRRFLLWGPTNKQKHE